MKINFDVKYRPQIESGEYKVETRDGLPARVICWNRRGERPVVVLVQQPDGFDDGRFYYESGLADGVGQESDDDLFLITPEPELTEFEEAVGAEIFDPPFNAEQVKVIKEESAKLLGLARKELCEQVVDHTKEAYENGKAEALKDLPRWRKVKGARGCNYSQETKFSINGRYLEMNDTLNDIYEISFEELEKLPGFNE